LTIIDSAVTNEIYNISGNIEIPNREVIKKILKYYPGIGNDQNWEDYIFHCNRVGQDVRYAIDDSKLKSLGWTPHADFDLALEDIVKYYIANFVW
jgi:dTDP-glucose 4,6-dehydratase